MGDCSLCCLLEHLLPGVVALLSALSEQRSHHAPFEGGGSLFCLERTTSYQMGTERVLSRKVALRLLGESLL